jgi:TfoX/Sxy family transcriptional regulator of competence genes
MVEPCRASHDAVVAYDEQLADRVRELVGDRTDFVEKKMFGGLAFMVNTHMACGLVGDGLMVRVGSENHEDALARGAVEMDFTGRPMRGMVLVTGEAVADAESLESWVDRAVSYANAQAPKPPKPSTRLA